jgi:3'(2'), 5'-bisphosphate nucleotidase
LIAEEDLTEIESHFDEEQVESFHQLVESFCGADAGKKKKRLTPAEADSDHGFWILDPIDGTKGVVSCNPDDQFAIGLAFVQNNEPVVGVMGLPNWCRWSHQSACSSKNGILLVAVKGYGTHLVELDPLLVRMEEEEEEDPFENFLQKVEVDGSTCLEESTFLISQRQQWNKSLPVARGFLNKVEEKDRAERRPAKVIKGCCGSLIKYAAVALGYASAYVEHPVKDKQELKVWDHAAGVICVEQAGGKVTDISGSPLRFQPKPFFKPKGLGIIASNGNFHNDLCKSLDNV